jgi:hypothetical protein
MEKLPAATGWQWIKQGFALFRKQPAEMSTLFLSYMFLMMILPIIPVVGQILPLLLIPVFSIAFMQACVKIEKGERVYPNLLLTGFRSAGLSRLLWLGLLYVCAAALATGASTLVDGGVFWKVMAGSARVDVETMRHSNIRLAMLVSGLLYVPAAMAFWYAAPLIAWQGMGIVKALFYSFHAVRRAGRAFLLYGLGWGLLCVLFPLLLSTVLGWITGSPTLMVVVLLPLSMVLTVVMYCSFYPSYTTVFGQPADAA